MPSFPLLPRQKDLIRNLKPYIESNQIEDTWIVSAAGDGVTVFGLDDKGELLQNGWREVTLGDLNQFEHCGFLRATRHRDSYASNYAVDFYRILEAIEHDFEMPNSSPPSAIHIGNVTGMVNINSTLENTSQIIGQSPTLEANLREELQALILSLQEGLAEVPNDDAEAIADQANILGQQLNRENPNKKSLAITADGLKKAAENVAKIAPSIFVTAVKIADLLRNAGLG